jgi:hypothetical protein
MLPLAESFAVPPEAASTGGAGDWQSPRDNNEKLKRKVRQNKPKFFLPVAKYAKGQVFRLFFVI